MFENPALPKRLAKYTVQQCFRNTVLEDYHAGTVPDSHTGDFSDVVVRTPHVEILWPHVSRLNDEEMELVVWDAVPSAGVSTARA
jgi:ligand-binding SRPBCC domain-containing protein